MEHNCELRKGNDTIFPVPLPGSSRMINVKRWFQKLLMVSDNDPRCKLYLRSRAALNFEKRRHARSRFWYIIHPFSKLRTVWEAIMIITLAVALVIIPFKIAFLNQGKKESEFTWLEYSVSNIERTSSAVCLIDIIVNFFTGYHRRATKEIILDPAIIARHYLGSHFIFDLVSSLPLDVIVKLAVRRERFKDVLFSMTLMSGAGILKILRLGTLIRYTVRFGTTFNWNMSTIRMARLGIIITMFLHWCACFHFLVPILVHGEGLYNPRASNSSSWVHRLNIQKKNMFRQYFYSLFRAVCNTVTVGYGHEIPKAFEDIVACTINILAGSALCIYTFVVLVHILLSGNAPQAKFQENMKRLEEFIRQKKISRRLRRRMILHYEHYFQNKYFSEKAIIATLSESLKSEILIHSCRRLVENVPLLYKLPKSIINSILSCLKVETYLPNDVIIKAGEHGDCMYFLTTGTVAVLTSTGKEVCHLEDNSHFGEIALIVEDDKRMASVLAVEICELYRLERSDFQNIFIPYPELYSRIERIAVQRIHQVLFLEEEHNRILMEKSLIPWKR